MEKPIDFFAKNEFFEFYFLHLNFIEYFMKGSSEKVQTFRHDSSHIIKQKFCSDSLPKCADPWANRILTVGNELNHATTVFFPTINPIEFNIFSLSVYLFYSNFG